MKYLIFGTLALILFFSKATHAQEWEQLNSGDVFNGESRIVESLHEVAIGYIIQKGLFESAKTPFPGKSYSGGYDNATYERQNTSTVTYYRFNFTLTEDNGPSTVDATVLFSYNPSNSNFIVKNYNYKVDSDGNETENGEETDSDPRFSSFYVDTRNATGDGDLASVVSDSFDSIIADHIEREDIPDAQYEIQFVYTARGVIFEGDEESNVNEEGQINEEVEIVEEEVEIIEEEAEENDNEGLEEYAVVDYEESSGPHPAYKYYEIFVKVKSSIGKYYLLVMDIYYKKENGEFVPDKSSLWGGFEFHE